MRITGAAVLHAPGDQVWQALQDPAVLVRTIPGCQRLELTGPDTYRATVTAGVASIRGSYSGEVRLSDQDEPSSFVLHASGQGAPGTVEARVAVRLHAESGGTTRLEYDADAVVGGMIGGVGQRMIAAVARRTAGEFFDAVDDVLTGVAAAPSATPPPPALTPPLIPPPLSEPDSVAPAPPGPVSTAGPTFTAPAQAPTPARPAGGAGAAAVGAGAALAGVVLGWLLHRRSRS